MPTEIHEAQREGYRRGVAAAVEMIVAHSTTVSGQASRLEMQGDRDLALYLARDARLLTEMAVSISRVLTARMGGDR